MKPASARSNHSKPSVASSAGPSAHSSRPQTQQSLPRSALSSARSPNNNSSVPPLKGPLPRGTAVGGQSKSGLNSPSGPGSPHVELRPIHEVLGLPQGIKSSQWRAQPSEIEKEALRAQTELEKAQFAALETEEEQATFNEARKSRKLAEKIVQLELEEKFKLINHNNAVNLETGKNALIQACIDERADLAKKLIQAQPVEFRYEYVNSLDSEGNSALFYCLDPANSQCFQLLLDYGANSNIANNKRNTPLHCAVAHNHKRTIKLLVEYGSGFQSENWEHQFPHQMTADSEKSAAMQNYINTCYDTHLQNLQDKKYLKVSQQQRCYYKSLFDTADTAQLGMLTLAQISPFLRQILTRTELGLTVYSEKEISPHFIQQWYNKIDRNKNGTIDFGEFVYAVAQYEVDKAKAAKKAKRRIIMTEKRKKQKAVEEEERLARQQRAELSRQLKSAEREQQQRKK
jgi:hypothetical protein